MLAALAGGTGSAKLVRGLARHTSEDLTVIVNVGDNISMHGLYICPDIDTILYALSGLLDTTRGWGVKDDTFHFLEQASKYGVEDWFRLGDRDLALHIARTELMKTGLTLTEVTGRLAEKMKISQRVLPASDQPIETMIDTAGGEMHLQEFWVKLKGEPEVLGVRYQGPEHPQPALGVVEAIRNARKVVICPANPVTSIGPITHISGIKDALASVRERVLAVSPILGNRPVSGPAGKLLRSIGVEVSPRGVAGLYSGFIGRMVIDGGDEAMVNDIGRMGVEALTTDILMKNEKDEQRLAEFVANV
ncbi:MAG: 2-phospho-L-lactate transferase [Nitrososphaerales archaeon]